MKHIIFALSILASSVSIAQNVEKDLNTIETADQAEAYIQDKQKKTHKLITFNAVKHNTSLAKELISTGVGATKVSENEFSKTYYKVVEKSNEPHYRLSYIFFDGNEMPSKEIDKLRKLIFKQHETQLESFSNLARKYSMAKNKFQGGDTNWVKLEDLPNVLANVDELLSHSLDEVYTVSNLDTNEFYIVKKTFPAQEIEEVKVIRVEERK
ncbi:peptidylprolyl isomerase [Aurantibacter aestuarii]|uniref:PpiC domain-containing protein n=1 Tax=Aurantibacter aestuarii TaxID=1266046 RepID=A0A2T1N8U3_9FLAO|nr:peptidylprolyl isomerase [Aurantibacter aestuarii]PSG88297.1 hypothetical protein C7H52_08310 [Aurantibacter aestuarii]